MEKDTAFIGVRVSGGEVHCADVPGEVLSPDALVEVLKLLAEVAPIDVEVEDARVVLQLAEGPVSR
jgi:hypothetical protein